jgi:hypothetical protein
MTTTEEAPAAAVSKRRALKPSRARTIIHVLMLVLALGTPLAFARAYFIDFGAPGNMLEPFADAGTYRAAAERLNAGHQLYQLQDGDRPVMIIPGLFTAPLLSPPPIAVLWRPIAAVEWGFALWVIACWTALLGTVIYLILRVGIVGVLLAFVLSQAIGEQLAVANAASFFPMLYVLIWRYRNHPTIGVILGLMATIKLAPIALTGWLLGTRRMRALAVTIGAVVGWLIVGGLGAGFGSYVDLVGFLPSVQPSPDSLSGQTGIAWMSYGLLAVGTIVAIALGRWPRLAYCVALLSAVFGSPALYVSTLVSLLALAAPLIGTGREMTFQIRRPRLVEPASAPLAEGNASAS